MIRYILILSLILNFLPANQVWAASGLESCDFEAYKNSITKTESATSGVYTAVNPDSCATGRYQFLQSTANLLDTYKSAPAGCKTMCQKGVGLASDACAPVQEAMMDELTYKNGLWLDNGCPGGIANIGQTITGTSNCGGTTKTQSCTLTRSALLAGMHYAGPKLCVAASSLQDQFPGGSNCMTIFYYACEHAGIPVPEECSPAPAGTVTSEIPTAPIVGNANNTVPPGSTAAFNSQGDALKYIWVAAFMLMTEQLTTVMLEQVQGIGMLLDAKHQLETQRLLQQKTAQAHNDYHPSVQMCEIGTFVRNLADTEGRAKLTKTAMANHLLARELVSGDAMTVEGVKSDSDSRTHMYRKSFCNTKDDGGGVNDLCMKKNGEEERQNRDIDFTQTIDAPLTLVLNPLDGEVSADEENLFSLLSNLFMHDPYPSMPESLTTLRTFVEPYERLRSLVAMRGIARNSIANIVAQKTAGPDGMNNAGPFLKAMMHEMGLTPEEAELMIGENPSYFAQMEILTKKIYQDPQFIINLYDKPANVKRIKAAMRAVKLMQDRDVYEALQRREMLLSIILELKIREYQEDVYNQANKQGSETESPGGG